MSNPIFEFKNDFQFLSNFYPVTFMWQGIIWPSSEHAYVGAKTLIPNLRLQASLFPTAATVKKFGRTIPLRPDWEQVKVAEMTSILRAKFGQSPALTERLILTGGSELEEGNYWGDTTWGICPAGSGNGQNLLGKILMRVRAELNESSENA